MSLNRSSGNMYFFLNDYPEKGSNLGYTWNTIKGKCPHDCSYCFMKRFGEQPDLHFDEKELKTKLVDPETGKEGLFIFVGSSCDMFAKAIPLGWIVNTLIHCRKFKNKYLFQTKNPMAIMDYMLPPNSIVGTTIETNRKYPQMGYTLSPQKRVKYMNRISYEYKTMVTIEPIIQFDLMDLVELVKQCHPEWVNIGADSQKSNLPEPPAKKIEQLIIELEKFTEVKIKDNLKRIFNAKT